VIQSSREHLQQAMRAQKRGAANSHSTRNTFPRVDAYSDEAGRVFRFQAGHRSDVKPAGIPI